jgi:hypothetical protein
VAVFGVTSPLLDIEEVYVGQGEDMEWIGQALGSKARACMFDVGYHADS